ncbi:MAG: pyridoxal phosphate-dependent aminotransferase family protein [Capnocytophaga sp.]|nr:pyridoxal phosphate-dependent aminotransferase family protein [Capnocytophaga sp.]
MKIPNSILSKIEKRVQENALRELSVHNYAIDFFSNDYLGFSQNFEIQNVTNKILEKNTYRNGSTGSRLLSGNFTLYTEAEEKIATFHQTQKALIFNSGYDANIGIFSSIPQKNDIVLYDQYIHASIRDGLQLSMAQSFKFKHNDLEDLEEKLKKYSSQVVYIATESVFSMDGDAPDLQKMVNLAKKYNAFLIVDEAHALGVFGDRGEGLTQKYKEDIFIRLVTFGKGLGGHGAAVLADEIIIKYLTNFARSFIYTTALPLHSVAYILAGYSYLPNTESREKLHQNIQFFREKLHQNKLENLFITSFSAIQAMIVSGNERVKQIAKKLQEEGFGVKPILSPTVPKGEERLRICLHSYNTKDEISLFFKKLLEFL